MSTIAFIGLGNMGSPMAQNLLASGFNVQVFALDTKAAKALEPFGAIVASSLQEVVDGAGTVITMLPAANVCFASSSHGLMLSMAITR